VWMKVGSVYGMDGEAKRYYNVLLE
jgi:hypothetical protein